VFVSGLSPKRRVIYDGEILQEDCDLTVTDVCDSPMSQTDGRTDDMRSQDRASVSRFLSSVRACTVAERRNISLIVFMQKLSSGGARVYGAWGQ